MKIIAVLVIILIGILITLYEWQQINQDQKREKLTFVILTVGSMMLAILLVFFPEMPGPTQLVEGILKPLGKLLEL